MMPIDRCSFEVVYKKDANGDEVIDHVVVRTGISDAAVSLTIPQVCNLARLLDVIPAGDVVPASDVIPASDIIAVVPAIPASTERSASDRSGHTAPTLLELRRAESISSE
jgi:hypothetical protein